jgi:hypothetical protein
MHGATPDQCRELERELDEFCRLTAQEGVEGRYAVLVQACRLHFRAYRDYLANRDGYDNYADYLSQVGRGPEANGPG